MRVPQSTKDIYCSFLDGSVFTNHKTNDHFHIHVTLYTDEWQTVNPLGTSRKCHKLNAFYWVFTNLDSECRSAVHVLQLACLARYSDVKD